MKRGNLFDDAAPPSCGERFDPLLQSRNRTDRQFVRRDFA
jgi:hypothetical protein